jgi:hypothetical protein
LKFILGFAMEQNPIGSSESNENNQSPTINEWSYKCQTTNNDNFEQTLVETFNDSSINDNSNAGRHEGHSDFTISENTQNLWNNQYESKDNQDNKDNSGYRRGGRGVFNKTNHSRSSIEKSWGHDFSNNFQSNSGNTRGRGRGRNFTKKFNEENNSFGDESNNSFNNQNGITATGYRGRGRGGHRGRGGRFRENSGGFYDNDGDGLKIKENKHSVPYIPPDIENEESIAGIEAGLNFDKYETIEVKVSGTDPPKSVTSFHSSGLQEVLLENLSLNKFSTSTPIQNYSIPIVIAGRDLMASAQTGSGKTVI